MNPAAPVTHRRPRGIWPPMVMLSFPRLCVLRIAARLYGIYFGSFRAAATRFAGGRVCLPCTVRFPAAVPREFPRHDRFVTPIEVAMSLFSSPFAGLREMSARPSRLTVRAWAPRSLLSSRMSREPFTTGRLSPAASDSDVKSVSPVTRSAWTACNQERLMRANGQ